MPPNRRLILPDFEILLGGIPRVPRYGVCWLSNFRDRRAPFQATPIILLFTEEERFKPALVPAFRGIHDHLCWASRLSTWSILLSSRNRNVLFLWLAQPQRLHLHWSIQLLFLHYQIWHIPDNIIKVAARPTRECPIQTRSRWGAAKKWSNSIGLTRHPIVKARWLFRRLLRLECSRYSLCSPRFSPIWKSGHYLLLKLLHLRKSTRTTHLS